MAADPGAPPDDAALRLLLANARTIAVVGFKERPEEAAYRIPAWLFEVGYRVIPVNPRLAGRTFLGEETRASLLEIPHAVDIVEVFRAAPNVPAHAAEALRLRPLPRLFWMQLGIASSAAAQALRAAGVAVVEDRCLMVEHRRLFGP